MSMKDVFNTIVVSQEPRGRYIEAIIDGTPKPGTIMQVKAATEPVGGRHTYTAYNVASDGQRPVGPIAVLCEDFDQGKTVDDAYAAGKRGLLYFPLPGDELLVLLADVAGTGDSLAIADPLAVDDGTGKAIPVAGTTMTIAPFVALETIAAGAILGDTLVHVMFSGY